MVLALEILGHRPFEWSAPDGYPDDLSSWGSGVLPRWSFAFAIFDLGVLDHDHGVGAAEEAFAEDVDIAGLADGDCGDGAALDLDTAGPGAGQIPQLIADTNPNTLRINEALASLAFDLGEEMQSGQSVREEILKRLEVTVPLSLVAVLLSYIIALPLGIASVRRQGTAVDGGLTIVLFVLYSIPTFWAGLMLVLIFGKTGADLLPILGLHDKDADPANTLAYAWDTVLHCILPILTLTYGSLAYLSRQMRAGMLDVIRQDYIRTAKAKGLSDDRVVYRHALRNSMIPVLTLLASILPILIGGSVIVEFIFDIPGMGKYAYEGLLRRDFSIVMATTIFVGVMTQLGILLSDITYSLVDPRIRHS